MKSTLEIIKMVEDFLEYRELSANNGFAPVNQKDFYTLANIVLEIVSAKWEPDPDGDYPVNVTFVNRNNKESLPYVAVTYRHINKEQYRKDIMANLQTAVREMQLSFDLDDIDRRFEERSAK